jgi:hypothetical protein
MAALAAFFISCCLFAQGGVVMSTPPAKLSGWGSGANVRSVAGTEENFSFTVAAGKRAAANPQIEFTLFPFATPPACNISAGWKIDRVTRQSVRGHWIGKPRRSAIVSGSVTCEQIGQLPI